MFELQGKYNNAKIFTNLCDQQTISQILELLNSPTSEDSKIRIMPDCHAGAGCVIGTTMSIKDRVCPNLVGVDIGCGMLCIKIGKLIDFSNIENLKKFDQICHNDIPSGFDVYNEIPVHSWKNSIFSFKTDSHSPWESIIESLFCKDKISNKEHLYKSLGTLGGGNHFIEINKDKDDNYYLVIHSGSRNLGTQVAQIYQKIAEEKLLNNNEEKNKLIEQLKKEGRHSEIQEKLIEFSKKKAKFSKELAFLTENDLEKYLHDLYICQEFASNSRKEMARILLLSMFNFIYTDKPLISFEDSKIVCKSKKCDFKLNFFETIHNYIQPDNKILRKGAVSAYENQLLLIPLNMRDGSLICIGKGNEDWNNSAPHGAGRLMSRSEAKEFISIEEFKETMKDVFSTSINQSTIDESPFAYKPMESIIENIKDTVEIVERIKPIYNFKASDTQ